MEFKLMAFAITWNPQGIVWLKLFESCIIKSELMAFAITWNLQGIVWLKLFESCIIQSELLHVLESLF